MKKTFAAALAAAASLSTFAFAESALKAPAEAARMQSDFDAATQERTDVTLGEDARSVASDGEVGEARRYYREQCNRVESPSFCDCVTAGVAQALPPELVRMAGETVGERLIAEGDAPATTGSDVTLTESSAARIENVEQHYADACAAYRR